MLNLKKLTYFYSILSLKKIILCVENWGKENTLDIIIHAYYCFLLLIILYAENAKWLNLAKSSKYWETREGIP